MTSTALMWHRSDLRVHDLPALCDALAAHERVVPCFVLDDGLLGRSPARDAFLAGCLTALDEELRARSSGLVVRRGRPEAVLVELARETGAEAVFWTSDVSPFARARDARVTDALRSAGVAARPATGAYCVDVSKVGGGTVFTPWWKRWADVPRREVLEAPQRIGAVDVETGFGEALGAPPPAAPAAPVVQPGEGPARAALDTWLREGLDHYANRQDGMSRIGTSQLSPYLRWGCLSARECEARARDAGGKGAGAWVRQLAWREFYAHVLLEHPGNVREEFQERYRGTLEWSEDADTLAAWHEGRTGFPLVDAGMRELAQTGWMHNRVRLVVGSFLTKDLHHDWRAGEAWFARQLLDGEPAQNNGNWQWIASVGVDPAPAFRRVFNPELQREKFDASGAYVARWVPEHGTPAYPEPIVDHQVERRVALERYNVSR
ncbi:MAG: deoxyribodipyrimidine photo-lyase [Solirubrobacteraceae bacterium]